MLPVTMSPTEKRQRLRAALASGQLQRFPGAFSPLVAMLIEESRFEGVYGSGAVLSASLGLPDIGLTSVQEAVAFGGSLSRVTNLPTLVDLDTGFGEPVNVSRAVQLAEEAGISAIHLEDQTLPKRCGHLENKELISADAMTQKIRAAVASRRDPHLVIVARTDARGVEGLDAAIERAQRYVDAGGDMIFPEALTHAAEFELFRKKISVPLMANMTEFGKSPLFTTQELGEWGYNLVIYPVTLLRCALHSVEHALQTLQHAGTQRDLLPQMQTRQRLYEVLHYADYAQWDQKLFNFKL